MPLGTTHINDDQLPCTCNGSAKRLEQAAPNRAPVFICEVLSSARHFPLKLPGSRYFYIDCPLQGNVIISLGDSVLDSSMRLLYM